MHSGTTAAIATATPIATAVTNLLDGLADAYQSALAVPGVAIVVVVLFLALGAAVSTYALRLLGRPVARRFARESVAHVILRGIRLVVILLFGAAYLTALVGSALVRFHVISLLQQNYVLLVVRALQFTGLLSIAYSLVIDE